ncbi:UNVERIFIED_ORG: hypothetical protein J2806_002472 [Kosakonia oryzae]|nr:hypothetical protein [Kosakonia oryzae]
MAFWRKPGKKCFTCFTRSLIRIGNDSDLRKRTRFIALQTFLRQPQTLILPQLRNKLPSTRRQPA